MKLGGSLERSRKGRRRRRSSTDGAGRLVLWLVGLALGGWFFGWLLATQVVFPAPPPPGDLFEVPDVRGLRLARASERLAGGQLEMGGVDSILHPTVPEGVILGQSPLRARIVLETTGFVVTTDSVESDVPRGRVVQVRPAVDSVLALPAEVRLAVSTGPPVVIMPLVLGLEEEAALATLDSLGLVVGEIEEVFRFGRDQGIVVEQEPAADTELERGAAVRLAVGRRSGRGPR